MRAELTPALRVVMFFTKHPEEQLVTQDMVWMFGIDRQKVIDVLSPSRRIGLLQSIDPPGEHRRSYRGSGLIWRAGPQLLSAISKDFR